MLAASALLVRVVYWQAAERIRVYVLAHLVSPTHAPVVPVEERRERGSSCSPPRSASIGTAVACPWQLVAASGLLRVVRDEGGGLEEVGPLNVFFARAQVEIEREGGYIRQPRLRVECVYVSS